MIAALREVRNRRELIANLVSRELKGRYKGSALGVVWSLLTPLIMTAIYAIFFRYLVGRAASIESIVVGIFAWQFTAGCITHGMTSVTGNANLVKKVAFPRWILPLATVLAGLVDYLISLAVQVVIIGVLLLMRGEFFPATILWLPLLIPLHAALNYAIALFLSGLNVVFRDTQHLVGPMVTALFFLSPAMYDVSFLQQAFADKPWLADLYFLNPLATLFSAYRACLFPGAAFPEITPWLIAGVLWPVLFFGVAAHVFHRLQKDFADYV
jgi:lipopolysaccharide transport system permease protein